METEEEIFEDEIDPRIKGELDALNQSADEINRLETDLSVVRYGFKASLKEAIEQLGTLSKKYGKSVERARPYYNAEAEAKKAHLAFQRAVQNFQRSNGIYRAAKETISLAESRLREFEDKKVDTAWQEMLSLQTVRFMEAKNDRTRSETLHAQAAKRCEFLDKKLHEISKKHRKSTSRAKPYFRLKETLEMELQKKRQKVEEIQRLVDAAKTRYRNSFENLERISNEIHEKRNALRVVKNNRVVDKLGIRQLSEEKRQAAYDSECQTLLETSELDFTMTNTCDEMSVFELDFAKSTVLDDQIAVNESNSDSDFDHDNETTAGFNVDDVSRSFFKTSASDESPFSNRGSASDRMDNATYRRLHGTTVSSMQHVATKSGGSDYDIFEDLC